MTVKELIEVLAGLPQDMQVYTGEAFDNGAAYVPASGASVTYLSHIEDDYHHAIFVAGPNDFEGVVMW